VNADGASVGGGISIWPEMDNMRLTKQEVINLSSLCVVLMLLVAFFFVQLHGRFVVFTRSQNVDNSVSASTELGKVDPVTPV
jgi:hypothetical protein